MSPSSRIVVVGLSLVLPGAAGAQTPSQPPRTAWGDPDLRGVWTNVGVTPLERPREYGERVLLTEEEVAELENASGGLRSFRQQTAEARHAGDPADAQRLDTQGLNYNSVWYQHKTVSRQTSLIIDPPDGQLPAFTAEGEARAGAGLETNQIGGVAPIGRRGHDGPEDRSLWERCLTRPIPRLPGPYNNHFLIVQTPDHVVVLMEMIHEARIIPLDHRPHLDEQVRQWLGDSRGRWEGDTLVVETTNFSNKTRFIGAEDNLRLVERFQRVDANTIAYEVTVEDATTWTRPWTARIPLARADGLPFEYACHEGNYGSTTSWRGPVNMRLPSRRVEETPHRSGLSVSAMVPSSARSCTRASVSTSRARHCCEFPTGSRIGWAATTCTSPTTRGPTSVWRSPMISSVRGACIPPEAFGSRIRTF